MKRPGIGNRTILDENTFDGGLKVRHIGWGFFWVAILLLAASWLVQGNEFFLAKFFLARHEQVRRQVFEESKAYNQGMAQTLMQYKMQYDQASDEVKVALRSSILHQMADYDADKLPPYLASWLRELRSER